MSLAVPQSHASALYSPAFAFPSVARHHISSTFSAGFPRSSLEKPKPKSAASNCCVMTAEKWVHSLRWDSAYCIGAGALLVGLNQPLATQLGPVLGPKAIIGLGAFTSVWGIGLLALSYSEFARAERTWMRQAKGLSIVNGVAGGAIIIAGAALPQATAFGRILLCATGIEVACFGVYQRKIALGYQGQTLVDDADIKE